MVDQQVVVKSLRNVGRSFALYGTSCIFSGLLLRHTTEELRELIFKSQELYPKIWKGIKWSERKMQWVAPSGARLWMSYLDRDDDVLRYQGLAFSWIGFDELTQWASPFAWNYMRSRLRSTSPDLPVYMRATTTLEVGDITGLRKCLLTLHHITRHLMQQILKQEKNLNILQDTAKQDSHYSNVGLYLLDLQITLISHLRAIMKQCFYPFLNSKEDNYWKAIGILKKEQNFHRV